MFIGLSPPKLYPHLTSRLVGRAIIYSSLYLLAMGLACNKMKSHTHTTTYKIDNQQSTIQYRKLYSACTTAYSVITYVGKESEKEGICKVFWLMMLIAAAAVITVMMMIIAASIY